MKVCAGAGAGGCFPLFAIVIPVFINPGAAFITVGATATVAFTPNFAAATPAPIPNLVILLGVNAFFKELIPELIPSFNIPTAVVLHVKSYLS